MGQNRLGTLPDTRPWRMVVAHLAEGANVAIVAAVTSQAAVTGLKRGEHDRGVAHAIFLLARIALAARKRDFSAALAELDVHVPAAPGLFDLTAAFTSAMRSWSATSSVARTDLGELGVLAASEALTVCVGERVAGLFPSGDEIHRTVREFSTRNGFAALAHEFFACFVRRFLLYHLGRELSQHVGGNNRFADHAEHAKFIEDLRIHSRETAIIARQYSGGWYDKSNFEKGITEEQARRFSAHCLGGKLRRELARRGERHG